MTEAMTIGRLLVVGLLVFGVAATTASMTAVTVDALEFQGMSAGTEGGCSGTIPPESTTPCDYDVYWDI